MKKLINISIVLLLLGSSIINVILVNRLDKSIDVIVETKLSNYKTVDTVIVDSLIYDTIYFNHFDTVRLTKWQVDTITLNDTTIIIDSVDVVLPIEVKHYSDTLAETAFFFETKGFQCEVNNLYVKNFLSVPTQEKQAKTNRFGVGVGLGITYIERFRLVPNVGIYYKLF